MRCLVLSFILLLPAVLGAEEKPILVLDAEGHTGDIWKVVFTPDEKQLITVSVDKTIRLWDVATGEPLRVIRPPIGKGGEGKLYAVALSPNGETLAVGGFGFSKYKRGNIYLISLAEGQIEQLLLGHEDKVGSLAFSSDGRKLVSGSYDDSARIWDVKNGKCERVLRDHTDGIYGVTFSPDGLYVATASWDKTARIWEVATGVTVSVLEGHRNSVKCVAWSPDGQTLATGSFDRSIRLWNADGSFRQAISDLGNMIGAVAFSPNSRELLFTLGGTKGKSNICSLLDVRTGKERLRFGRHTNSVFDGVFSPSGKLIATTGGNNADTYVWTASDGKVLHHLVGKGRTHWSAAWSLKDNTIAWGDTNRGVAWNNLGPLEYSFHLEKLDWAGSPDASHLQVRSSLGSLSLDPRKNVRGHFIAVKSEQRTLAYLDLPNPKDVVRSFTLISEDRTVVGTLGGPYLFETRTGRLLQEFVGHTGTVWATSASPKGRYVLSASADQTLRIWKPGRREPLLSLFFAGREWIAWTPEGYYACSAGGETLIGWHLNRGKDKLAEFHPAVRFRNKFYRPEVIKLLLRTGSLERALAIADKARGQKTELSEVAKVLPPLVEITSPQAGKVDRAQLTIQATAQSRNQYPVITMKLLIDGQQLPGTQGRRTIRDPKLGQTTASWNVTLDPGRHQLQVLAESKASQGISQSLEVRFAGKRLMVRKPRLIVLAIGISTYDQEKLKLHYAASDAKVTLETLTKHSGELFREIETKLLVDKAATKDNILNGLDWMIRESTDEDYVVLYFAGHGELDTAGNLYFLPVSADTDRLRSTALAGEEFLKALRDLPRSRRILILDACHAGAVGQGKRRSGQGATDDLIRDLLLPGYGTVVMCSSTGKEFSQESNAHRMGVFTLALTEGLSGKGGKDKSGTVFTHHLHSYVCDRVKELTKGRQHPLMKNPHEVHSFPVSKPK